MGRASHQVAAPGSPAEARWKYTGSRPRKRQDPLLALHKAGSITNEQLEAAARLRHDYQLRVAAMMPASARLGVRVDESTVPIGVPLSVLPDGYDRWEHEMRDEWAPGDNDSPLAELAIDVVVDGKTIRQCADWYRCHAGRIIEGLCLALDRYPS